MSDDWLNNSVLAPLDWTRFKSDRKQRYEFIFRRFPEFEKRPFNEYTAYFWIKAECCRDYDQLGLVAKGLYSLNIPEKTFVRAWQLCQRKPVVSKENPIHLRVVFSRSNKNVMVFHSIEAVSEVSP